MRLESPFNFIRKYHSYDLINRIIYQQRNVTNFKSLQVLLTQLHWPLFKALTWRVKDSEKQVLFPVSTTLAGEESWVNQSIRSE